MKLSKKWLCLLMAVALLVSCAVSALADPKFVVEDGIAVKYLDTSTDVITADMFTDEGITTIGASCFKGTDVASVSIPETVTSIQAQAFSDCRNLSTVSLPDKITAIPDNCFSNATALTSISIPSGVTSIGISAFRNCISLTAVEGTETVKTKAADDYKPVTGNVTSVGEGSFSNCPEVVISCFKGSALEAYAINNKIKYESLDPVIDSITPSQAEYTLVYTKGSSSSFTVPVTIKPDIAASADVAWSTNNETLAAINQAGVITVKGSGVVTITVMSQDVKAAMASVKLVILDSSKGWQDLAGSKYYCTADGFATGKTEISGKKYFFNSLGKLQTGWIKSDNVWYYSDETSGVLQTGWKEIPAGSSTWFYFNGEGVMQTGWLKDGRNTYYLNPTNGAMVTGTQTIGGKQYTFRSSGSLIEVGWYLENNKWYYVDAQYHTVTGWLLDNGSWYYLNPSDGVMATGWINVGGAWYLMSTSGAMRTGWVTLSEGKYYLDSVSGKMATGWLKLNEKWYYFSGSGLMQTGWQQIGGTWYYLYSDGSMAVGLQQINGATYYLTSSGAMATGWQQIGGAWYYFAGSGAMVTGWQQIGGKWYYFWNNGVMVTGTVKIGGVKYRFDNSGAWIN